MEHFYHNMVRKYVISFGHLFSDINVMHTASDEESDPKEINVPIIYATKSKMYYEIRKKTTERDKAIVNTYVPRMGFFISGMQYDATRKRNNTLRMKLDDDRELAYPGVPYNFNFELAILTKKQDDLFQILEQIGVMFTPDRTVTIKEIDGIDRDVSINLDTVSLSSIFEYSEDESRTISADLTFTLKGHLYPRIDGEYDGDGDGNIIKSIINNYGINLNENFGTTVEQTQETPDSEIIKNITNNW